MYFDLNVPVQKPPSAGQKKAKQPEKPLAFPPTQINAIEARVNVLVHLGYTVIAFSQTVHKKIESKTHTNFLDGLLSQLQPRPGIVYLKRLNIILDQDSEKGFGLTNANNNLLNAYDLIALIPTTHTTFSLACLTHSLPSPLTAHIIALPLTLPRLPYHLKHSLVRTAIKNGACFEVNYVGSLGGDHDPTLVDANAAESGESAKRNWWAAARELARVTKGKGVIISGGVVSEADLRAPRDVANLLSVLGLAQDSAHEASTKAPRSLVVRAQTRKTYRAVFSEPRMVFPGAEPPINPVGPPIPLDREPQEHNNTDTTVPQKRGLVTAGSESIDHSTSKPSTKKKRKRNQKEGKNTAG